MTTAGAGKSETKATDSKEPFEFEKCTINLNLSLLPVESGKNTRKVIVGVVSHDLPPEIEFLEINNGDDLTQIAALVSEKLGRFKQTLPVKYIEQLRQSKNKSAKRTAAAATQQSAGNQTKSEKTSGEQKTREATSTETVKPQTVTATENSSTASSTAPLPTVNQSGAANNIQGSLF